jgi:hypothetical protein
MIFIHDETYNRVTNGNDILVVRITKLYESDGTKHAGQTS